MDIEYKEFKTEYMDEVRSIYKKERWMAYLHDDKKLINAFNHSCYILGAFLSSHLIGFIRCVGDEEHIILLQDLVVDPIYQKQSIGTNLINKTLEHYKNVRMIQVNTDISTKYVNDFYKSFGFKKLKEGEMISYYR